MTDLIELFPPMDEAEVGRLLVEHDGSVSAVAKELDVGSGWLRRYVKDKPALMAIIQETFENAADEAIGVLYQGLRDPNSFQNRFYCAKEFLRSAAGRARGFGGELPGSATLELKRESGQKTITLRWIEPKDGA